MQIQTLLDFQEALHQLETKARVKKQKNDSAMNTEKIACADECISCEECISEAENEASASKVDVPDVITSVDDFALIEKWIETWENAAGKLQKLVADKNKLDELICKGMDPCVAPICNAMNLVPDVRTNSSCEGHEDGDEFFIQFYCDSMQSLHFLCDVFSHAGVIGKLEDGREFDFTDWDIELRNWHASLQFRRFETVEFDVFSKSLGGEKDKELKLAVAEETARVLAAKARDYAEGLKICLERKKKLAQGD